MKKIIGLIFLLTLLHSLSFAQIRKSSRLKIYSITEYIDGYVIKGIDTSKSDTLSIISVKDSIKNKRKFKKIAVGEEYNFEYDDLVGNMAAVPPNSFVVRIKTTVVWRHGDGAKNIPVFSRNMKGLWIKE